MQSENRNFIKEIWISHGGADMDPSDRVKFSYIQNNLAYPGDSFSTESFDFQEVLTKTKNTLFKLVSEYNLCRKHAKTVALYDARIQQTNELMEWFDNIKPKEYNNSGPVFPMQTNWEEIQNEWRSTVAEPEPFQETGCNIMKDKNCVTTEFQDGQYIVGTDITYGTYRVENVELCLWKRLRDFSGTIRSIIAANAVISGTAIVTIHKSDKGFESTNCGTWIRVD